eukprot:TRINITY_DN30884_c0_g1_i1.p1 TRINITY_DN30884_c0_g1~~TRINITY_DN30884_c0_g1_i1.p1  ORF type:complete len:220 (+),score=45.41 TRINITY_DN30884_c0_g1_i1:38-697(+)
MCRVVGLACLLMAVRVAGQNLAEATAMGDVVTQEPVPTIYVPDRYVVVMETDILLDGRLQDVVINVTKSFAPLGAEQLYKLVKEGFYNEACFFRVVPDFVVQFGLAADPDLTEKWAVPILDDPIEVSNEESTVTFAASGPDSRTTQIFVNLRDNKELDTQYYAPFGQVIKGMDAIRSAYNPTPGKSGGVDQYMYATRGNTWLKSKVPRINQIVRAYITE